MRLISQDGKIDVSYEQVAIEIEDNSIYCGYSSIVTRHCTGRRFAEYSSNEKALKAMEMLREEYDYVRTFETICNGSSNYPNLPSYIFQFPKDEEIEV